MIWILTVFLAMAVQPGHKAPSKESIARDVIGALKGLTSLSFTARIETKGTSILRGEAKQNIMSLEASMKKGGKFRVEAVLDGKSAWSIVCDGKQLSEWNARENSWTRYPVQLSTVESYVRNLVINRADAGIATYQYGSCWLDDESGHAAWLQRVIAHQATRVVGTRKVAGRECVLIQNDATEKHPNGALSGIGSENFSMYFDRETHFLAREIDCGVGGPLGIPIVSFQRDILYSNIAPDPVLSDELFIFQPPPGSTFISPDDPRFAPPPKLEGKPAPEFSLPLLDGQTCCLADYRGKKPVLLVFWATWCGPCNQEIPFLRKLRKEQSEESLAILAISAEKGVDGVASFTKKKKLNYPVLHDAKHEVSKAYQAQAIPRTVLIDKSGKVVKIWQGWSGEEEAKEIRSEIAKVLE